MPALTGFDKKWVTLQIVLVVVLVLVLKNHCKFEDEDENEPTLTRLESHPQPCRIRRIA